MALLLQTIDISKLKANLIGYLLAKVVHDQVHLLRAGESVVSPAVAQVHDVVARAVVGVPVSEISRRLVAVAVGISGLDKVGPVGGHLLGNGKVLLGEGVDVGVGVEGVKRVHDFALVEGALVLPGRGVCVKRASAMELEIRRSVRGVGV